MNTAYTNHSVVKDHEREERDEKVKERSESGRRIRKLKRGLRVRRRSESGRGMNE